MQIYSKSTKNATSPLFTKIIAIPQICTSGREVYYASRNLLIHLLFIAICLIFVRNRTYLNFIPVIAPSPIIQSTVPL